MIYILAYLIGCIQSGVLISKYYNVKDPRLSGSKNIGTTNMWRLYGWQLGVTTFIFDVAKILLIFIIGKYHHHGSYNVLLMSLGTLGHLYPIQNPLKGGKGIACTFMFLLLYNPFLFIITAASWLASYKITNTSGTSASTSILICLMMSFTYVTNINMLCLRIILILCLVKHRINIKDAITEYRSAVL